MCLESHRTGAFHVTSPLSTDPLDLPYSTGRPRFDAMSLLQHEPLVRLLCFAGVFALLALWEIAAPRRNQQIGRAWRWPHNLGVVVVDAIVLRLLFPTAAVGMAIFAEAKGWGLLNVVALPGWAKVIAAIVILDLAIYLQHVLFHAVPALWRLHRMHHADLEFDVTTGVRFHPIEIVLSMLLKFAVIAAFGAPALGVLIFEVLLNATSMFSHSNVRIAPGIDRWLRWLVVTPDMHRVHHSIERKETDSNYGFNLPWWDRLFGTYRPAPEAGHDGMTIGIKQFRDLRELRLDRMLCSRCARTEPKEKAAGNGGIFKQGGGALRPRAALAALLAETHLLGELGARLSVVRRDHRIIGR